MCAILFTDNILNCNRCSHAFSQHKDGSIRPGSACPGNRTINIREIMIKAIDISTHSLRESISSQVRSNNYCILKCKLMCEFLIVTTVTSQTLNTDKYSLRIIRYPGTNKDADPILEKNIVSYSLINVSLTLIFIL